MVAIDAADDMMMVMGNVEWAQMGQVMWVQLLLTVVAKVKSGQQ